MQKILSVFLSAVLSDALLQHIRQEPAEAEAAPAEGAVAAPAEGAEAPPAEAEAPVEEEAAPEEEAAAEADTRVIHKSGQKCQPLCNWECDNPVCEEVCTPMCAAPTCKTYCQPVIQSSCTVECEEPDCQVLCPRSCRGGSDGPGCGACKTVCNQPRCKTTCQQNCLSKCAEPICTWQCNKAEACPRPKCKMVCATCDDNFQMPSQEVEPWQVKDAVLQKVGQAKVGNFNSTAMGGAVEPMAEPAAEAVFFQLPPLYSA